MDGSGKRVGWTENLTKVRGGQKNVNACEKVINRTTAMTENKVILDVGALMVRKEGLGKENKKR